MRVALVGATGETGRAVLAAAGSRGIGVRALVRRAAGLTDEVVGDATADGWVGPLLTGVDAVICVIGPRPRAPVDTCSRATRILVDGAREAGIRRIVVQTGAMIGHARLSFMYRLIRAMLPAEQRAFLADRRLQERIVQESGLDWTIVRPPRLTSGRPTGRVASGADRLVGALARVDRADLATFLLDAAADPALVGQAVTVASI